MSSVGVVATFSMIVVLLWSSLEKLRTFERTSETFFDFRNWIDPVVAVLTLSIVELLCVMGMLIAPGSPATLSAIFGLATIFAAGGMWALVAKKQIRCNCFGSLGTEAATLGKAQLIWFVFWVAGIGMILMYPPPSVTIERGVATATAAALLVTVIRSVETLRAARVSKGDRLSADRMLTWLH